MSDLKSTDLYNVDGVLFRVINSEGVPTAVERWEKGKGFVPFGNLAEVEYNGLPLSKEESEILMI